MTMFRITVLLVTMLVALQVAGPAPAQSRVPLAEEAHINEQLIAGAAGDILRKTCPAISARMFTVWNKLYQLRSYAIEKGYTEPEVKAFLKDAAQKARVKAAAEAYLAASGAVAGNVESLCQVGRDEIAKGTTLGQIIRVDE